MENIAIGDELWDRDTRRVGRKLKVVWVDQDSVTAEVIADSINSKKTTVGNNTDIARDRLKKGYTLHKTLASLDLTSDRIIAKRITPGKLVVDGGISKDSVRPVVNVYPSETVSEEVVEKAAKREMLYHGLEPAADDELVNDLPSLHDALNSAGYFWLPPVEDLLAAVAPDAPATTKTGLVHLIHNIIRESLVTGQ